MRIILSGIIIVLLLASSVVPLRSVGAQASPSDLLPTTLPLPHADCFRIDGEEVLDFDGLLARFANVPDAATQLSALGWQAGAFRQFGCDAPPSGSAGWIDMSVHQFADPAGATAAAPFFAASRVLDTSLQIVPSAVAMPGAIAITGPASNGTEYTLYMPYQSVLFRVTGVAPVGSPQHDVEQVTNGLIAIAAVLAGRQEGAAEPSAAPVAEYSYIVIDLGTGDGNWSSAHDINNADQVLWAWGQARDSLELETRFIDRHAMLSMPGSTVELWSLGIDAGIAINNEGVVLGTTQGKYYLYDTRNGQIEPVPDLGENAWFVDINDDGILTSGEFVVEPQGVFRPPVPPGFDRLGLVAISNTGWIAGTVSIDDDPRMQRAALITEEGVAVLGPAPGAAGSNAVDVNDLGQLIGNPERLGVHFLVQYGTAFLYDPNTRVTTDLETLPGYRNSTPAAINNASQVVGAAWAPWDDTLSFRRAFLYDHRTGVMTDLNTLIDPASGWVLIDAYDINDTGQIVGRGFVDGETHAFLLIPHP